MSSVSASLSSLSNWSEDRIKEIYNPEAAERIRNLEKIVAIQKHSMKTQRKHACSIRNLVKDYEKELTDVKSECIQESSFKELTWSKEEKIKHRRT